MIARYARKHQVIHETRGACAVSISIAGMKLTHDSSVALAIDGILVASHEREKRRLNHRYSEWLDLGEAMEELATTSDSPPNEVVIDGWFSAIRPVDEDSSHAEFHVDPVLAVTASNGAGRSLRVAPYREPKQGDELRGWAFQDPEVGAYVSYTHVTGHVMSAYALSPWAVRAEPAYVLVWDAGTDPRLYEVVPRRRIMRYICSLLRLRGSTFTRIAMAQEPFVPTNVQTRTESMYWELSTAGKAMAYTALGEVDETILSLLDRTYEQVRGTYFSVHADEYAARVVTASVRASVPPATLLCSFQDWVARRLTNALWDATRSLRLETNRPLLIAGGCGLNIKWNTAVRRAEIFRETWVPPVPNDAGSAIGQVAAHSAARHDRWNLDWMPYLGPSLSDKSVDTSGWRQSSLTAHELGVWIASNDQPVVVLSGRAEIGPRALGNRSVLADPRSAKTSRVLNRMKRREAYRPIAPVCLESHVDRYFSPGWPDPYMVFEQRVREEYLDELAAVTHIDGTARVQTTTSSSNSVLAAIIEGFASVTGLPVLCNTSANLPGTGFFTGLDDALAWGECDAVWCEQTLYTRVTPA